MKLDLKNKRVLVTGSSRGIGLTIAKAFLTEGCKVIINGRKPISLNKVINTKENYYKIFGDITKEDEAHRLIKKSVQLLGGIDIIVCNVGNGTSVIPGKESRKEWEKMFEINLFSTTNIVEASRIHLKKSKGVIICISSICGSEVIPGAPVTYSVAKAALNAYIKGISRPLADDGVKINGVAPGNILFSGSVWDKKIKNNSKLIYKMIDENVPLKKFGTTKDIANLVLYLASPLSQFITGSIYHIDGGQTRS
tara:strand:+ start:349 stop:1104 length:756 start_codon:yes stop_codon:yes gene_type:complete